MIFMANYVDQINLNGNVADIIGVSGDRYYPGVDLTEKFASEIANYSDAWAWIRARIRARDFSKIHVADYIPFTCTNNNKLNARVAGINTYKDYGDSAVGNHIDFISSSLWPTTFKMNQKNFNNGLPDSESLTGDGSTAAFTLTNYYPSLTSVKINGTATTAYTYDAATQTITFTEAPASGASIVVTCDNQAYPWLVSNGYHFLNSLAGKVPDGTGNKPALVDVDYTEGGVYNYLPTELKNVIVEKRMYLPKRFSASGIQSEDTAGGWVNAGKLWLPTEMEVTGAPIWGCNKYGAMGSVQYPLFANNMNRNIGRSNWWTLSASAGNTTLFVLVTSLGIVANGSATSDNRGPVCFRVA
jgi:hypothetical protein